MAKLKNKFITNKKLPIIAFDSSSAGGLTKTAVPKDLATQILKPTGSERVPQTLNFGKLHTKAVGSATSSGAQWTNLLSAASGGVGSLLGGGLISSGGFGFVGKLLSLFGGSKKVPTAPVAFQSPISQQNSLNIISPGSQSSISLGVHSVDLSGNSTGIYKQNSSLAADHYSQSAQVVQIVKQALLTSSSLNDVIAEI
jgi:hypothetical protein